MILIAESFFSTALLVTSLASAEFRWSEGSPERNRCFPATLPTITIADLEPDSETDCRLRRCVDGLFPERSGLSIVQTDGPQTCCVMGLMTSPWAR